ncbi:ferric reductase-like transmembrane domain-containing protein [Adlercreutzia sp. R25]|uniref:Ferric reductase-like transmembrane domain-containing protein n=1 Tax=Adlercreutzia shanghongiae TaxID=3111773 RepID=A0ABU6J136_9ACTN|nr:MULTISPECIES: ferric reductase-like transmembrane domain-containing protein [unclassified Adlercreutzia]MEC4271611.1 ferric reductase-like transmembrane domain-containing protein [Adlercreutzia sp. R25]MEC4295750.1 ferric reductase-like transmembrane domain-containing protein [Adlercreutzia sp. R22]
MRFIIALVLSLALVVAFAKPLKKYPIPFYLGAVALVGLYFWGVSSGMRGEAWSVFQQIIHRCALAFLLFSVVMFVGVLNEKSRLRAHLMPIRRQLSIIACILAVGHIAFYTNSYLPHLVNVFSGRIGLSFGLAAFIALLMIALFVTSFLAVKHRMKAAAWKAAQRLAYPFYLLTYVHLALLLMPSALSGSQVATVSIIVYSLVAGAYVVLRTCKALADHVANAAPIESEAELELVVAQ